MSATAQRYTAVAIVLHWAIAFAILFMIPLGFWMHIQAEHGDASPNLFRAYQLHKSIGLTVLALSLVRLGWRLVNPPPPLPEHMPTWERVVSKATHWAFYGLMIGLPLSGWLYVSAGWSIHTDSSLAVPTHWFGLFQVPALFDLPHASDAVRSTAANSAFVTHYLLAYAAIALVVMHVAAALKHHLFDRDEVLAHMVPGLRAPFEKEAPPKNPVRLAVLGVGLSVTVIAAAAALFTAANIVYAPAAPPHPPSSFEVVETPAPATTTPGTNDTATPAPTAQGAVSSWRVDPRSSTIGFAYTYSDDSGDTHLNGRFTRWRADIRFDPNNLEGSSVVVRIETASAATGVAIHDSALPTEAWFDAAHNPTAEFRTTRIRARAAGQYEARGNLTIKGVTRQVDLPFTLRIDGNQASMNGRLSIDRGAFHVGDGAEGDDMISHDVDISVRVDAARTP